MSYELFEEEAKVIDHSKALLESDQLSGQAKESFASLLKSYQKLFKSSKRMMRLSDRNEKNLKEVSNSLDEKNAMLEGLSHQLSKYLSPQVYATIFKGERQVGLTTERKKLTVFFSDIKDFTATTDDLEPEDLTFLINDYLTDMTRIALKHGATIDKYIGDAILIFFGDPDTLGVKEDALACVRMAVDMQRHMMDLRAKWTEMGYAKPFHMRVGINTGFCNVGNFGSEERMDYTIIGGEVNLAARLEGVADPDGITLSYETYALVKDFIDAERGDPINVKGIHRKVTPYKMIGVFNKVDEQSRFLRSERDGMRLFLDFEKLDEHSRTDVINEMKLALSRLEEENLNLDERD
uniref:Putative Adenylate cyclase n=1 Tax=Magnetococcus massalia (strain MO-1) TaxID=451514 RepID=A0A1S7LHG8_MAGMO|nr:putative Adenylate cyclase [Candidatus Magnetococcus massalia]